MEEQEMIETTLNGKTKNIVQENIEQLKQLFPEIVTEDKIDFDKLKDLLISNDEIPESNEKYDFTWNGKRKSSKISLNPIDGTLRPIKEKSKNWEKTNNIYIEGNNLDVLKLLQKSYYGKIKMIYLDPPYNTGKDFVYEDKYEDSINDYLKKDKNGFKISSNQETSGKYHTNWLNMMYSRLKLGRNLLSENGVIFISIDDNEVTNLKKICDEIFGEFNCILTTIINRPSEIGTEYSILKHEYLLIYCKNKNYLELSGNEKYTISRGTVGNQNQTTPIIEFPAGLRCENIDDGIYSSTRKIENSMENITNLDEIVVENGFLKNPVRLQARWRSSNDMRNFFNNNCQPTKAKINGIIEEIWFKGDRFMPQIKKRVTQKIPSIYQDNKRGSKNLEDLFNKKVFDFPKSVSFIEDFISLFSEKDDIILDFFAGSSSTAEAVLSLNTHTNKNNSFIMVQLPEKTKEKSEAYKDGYKNICEIGEERIRRAGDKLLDENPDADIDIGFKVFKLDSSNLTKWNPDVDNLEDSLIAASDNIVEGRSELDLVYEIMLKYGVELTEFVEEISFDKYTFYSVGMGSLVICLNNHVDREVAEDILKIKEKMSPDVIRVVFKDNSFESDSDKTNVKEILRNNEVDEFITI